MLVYLGLREAPLGPCRRAGFPFGGGGEQNPLHFSYRPLGPRWSYDHGSRCWVRGLDALTKLSREHREIIDLVYYHEKSVDDAAQVLGIPSATVKTRMFYARKKLAELVQA